MLHHILSTATLAKLVLVAQGQEETEEVVAQSSKELYLDHA